MEKKNEVYHIKIYSIFLFEFKELFDSSYSRWIYIYLKLKNNAKIQFGKEDYYPLNVDQIAGFFNIDRATVFDCLKDLRQLRLLSKKGRNLYRLEGEELLIETYCMAQGIESNIHEEQFIPIHNNFFKDMFNSGCGIKEAEVYYYLVNSNGHYAIKEPLVEVNVRNNKVCADLRMDHRTLKKTTIKLLDAGLLIKERNGKLLTKAPKPIKKCNKLQPLMKIEWSTDKSNPLAKVSDKSKLNENFLGWYKSIDGMRETEMLRHSQFKVVLGGTRLADGIPPTPDQIERQKRIRETGVVAEQLEVLD